MQKRHVPVTEKEKFLHKTLYVIRYNTHSTPTRLHLQICRNYRPMTQRTRRQARSTRSFRLLSHVHSEMEAYIGHRIISTTSLLATSFTDFQFVNQLEISNSNLFNRALGHTQKHLIMTGHDRKRNFGQAFQLALSAIPNFPTPIPKTITAASPSEFSTPIWFNDDKENESPFDQDKDGATLATPGAPQADFHWPLGMAPFPLSQTQKQSCRAPPLQTLTPLCSNAGQATGETLLPLGRDDFRPSLSLDANYPIDGNILGCIESEPGFIIHEDETVTRNVSVSPLTPGALNLQELSLTGMPSRPPPKVPISPIHPGAQQIRASVYVGRSSQWAG
jgi:hypothetical protein